MKETDLVAELLRCIDAFLRQVRPSLPLQVQVECHPHKMTLTTVSTPLQVRVPLLPGQRLTSAAAIRLDWRAGKEVTVRRCLLELEKLLMVPFHFPAAARRLNQLRLAKTDGAIPSGSGGVFGAQRHGQTARAGRRDCGRGPRAGPPVVPHHALERATYVAAARVLAGPPQA